MAVMIIMKWPGVTPEQYDAVRKDVNWEGDRPKGALFHVASFGDGALHVTDLWESPEDFGRFVEQRLSAGAQRAGVPGQPETQVFPVHATYTPAYKPA